MTNDEIRAAKDRDQSDYYSKLGQITPMSVASPSCPWYPDTKFEADWERVVSSLGVPMRVFRGE